MATISESIGNYISNPSQIFSDAETFLASEPVTQNIPATDSYATVAQSSIPIGIPPFLILPALFGGCYSLPLCNLNYTGDPEQPRRGDEDGDLYFDKTVCRFPEQEVGDCNDDNFNINPDAREVCDGVDQDCDGQIDEGVETACYPDTDVAVIDSDDDGWSAEEDCDDQNPDVYPDATEICNDGIDNNCTGQVDQCVYGDEYDLSQADATIGQTSYPGNIRLQVAMCDLNGDSYADIVVSAPNNDVNGVENAGGVYVFNGPVTGSMQLNDADAILYGNEDSDAGSSLTCIGDLNGDGREDLAIGAPNTSNNSSHPWGGATYIMNGPAISGVMDEVAIVISGDSDQGYFSGTQVTAAGDMTNDGIPDLLITDRYNQTFVEKSTSMVYLMSGPITNETSVESAAARWYTLEMDSVMEVSIAGGTDVTGDGISDALIGYPQAVVHDGLAGPGIANLVYGPIPIGGNYVLENVSLQIKGEEDWDTFSDVMTMPGDLDGDGYGDLIIAGKSTYLIFGSFNEEAGEKNVMSLDTTKIDYEASAASGGGDVDGDGTIDLVLSMSDEFSYGGPDGNAHLLLGPIDKQGAIDINDSTKFFSNEIFSLSNSIASDHDVNNDGLADILLGASSSTYANPESSTSPSAVFLVFGLGQ